MRIQTPSFEVARGGGARVRLVLLAPLECVLCLPKSCRPLVSAASLRNCARLLLAFGEWGRLHEPSASAASRKCLLARSCLSPWPRDLSFLCASEKVPRFNVQRSLVLGNQVQPGWRENRNILELERARAGGDAGERERSIRRRLRRAPSGNSLLLLDRKCTDTRCSSAENFWGLCNRDRTTAEGGRFWSRL